MPFQNGFDPMTYGLLEWVIIGGSAAILILIILLIIVASSKKGATKIKPVKSGRNSFLCEATNEALIVSGENAWLSDNQGMTELLRAIDGSKVKLAGKVVYFNKEVKKISVSQEGDQLKRGQTFERQYVTLDFVSDAEVRIGTRVFTADEALRIRDEKQKVAEAKAAKLQAKEDAKLAKKSKNTQDN